jgi:hypothetical protein
VIVNGGHRSGIVYIVLIFLPIISCLFCILIRTVGCRGKELLAALWSLLKEVVLFI